MVDLIAPYANQSLHLPREFDGEFSELLVSGKDGSDKPFARKVDLWWLTICIGARLGHHRPISKDRVHFNTVGQIFGNEPWRVTHMELLALGREGEDCLQRPGRVVEIAEEYGMVGISWITDRLRGANNAAIKLLIELDALGSGGGNELLAD